MNANTTMNSVRSRARGGVAATLALTTLALAGCGGGGSGGGGPAPAAPQGVVAFAGDGEVTLTWTPTPEAESYAIYWDTQPGVTKQSGRRIAGVKAPYLHQGLPNLRELHYVVAARSGGREGPVSAEVSATPRVTAGQFKPSWAGVQPAKVLSVEHDPGRTDAANGQHLADRIAALAPGERLEIGAGHWVLPDFVSIDLQGSASAPIWIAARPGTRPVLTRANRNDAVLHVGAAGGARYLVLMGLELTGGDRGFDLWDAREVWVDLNLISRNGGTPVAADSASTQAVYITRNQLDHAGGDGHGIVLGAADGSSSSTGAVVAQNQVSHCRGVGATGIWVRQGSAGNWIVENVVHDTDWPCILVEGSGGGAWNTIERNLAYGSRDTVVEVQSQAHVLNNLVMDGLAGLVSRDGASTVRDLEVVHNTIVNARRAVSLEDWSGRPGLVFANNVAYSERGEALRIVGGSNGVLLRGNVLSGIVQGVPGGYTPGNGLSDFVDVTWSASRRDATPSPGGAIVDSADAAEHLPEDLTGRPRDMATLESGCLDVE